MRKINADNLRGKREVVFKAVDPEAKKIYGDSVTYTLAPERKDRETMPYLAMPYLTHAPSGAINGFVGAGYFYGGLSGRCYFRW